MEFGDVSEEVERECRRVAAAFGVKRWEESQDKYDVWLVFQGNVGTHKVEWCLRKEDAKIVDVVIREVGKHRSIFRNEGTRHTLLLLGKPHDFLARGLYRLGFTDTTILAQLPLLSAHEKLELRLSLPREFWPQKWVDEEKAAGDL